MCCGIFQEWQKRIVVVTKEDLFFALVDDDLIRDRIPLHEIEAVDIMQEPHEIENLLSRYLEAQTQGRKHSEVRRPSVSSRKSDRDEDALELMRLKVFQIRTIENGYNAGRPYYVQAESPEDCSEFVADLENYVVVAKRRANGSSRFIESQRWAQRVYNSPPFQIIAAILIITV